MITTGLIKQINLSSGTYSGNKYLVELNLFQIPGDKNKRNYTYEANCCIMPGFYDSYNVGDKVYVSFLHDEMSIPIIIGKIYQGRADNDTSYRSHVRCQCIDIGNSAKLPKDTNIGDITYEQLLNLFRRQSNIYYNHIISCRVDDNSEMFITFKIQNRIKNSYTDLNHLTGEIKRLTNMCSISCDIYNQNLDSTYTHKGRGYVYVDNTDVLQAVIEDNATSVKNILEDQVVEI